MAMSALFARKHGDPARLELVEELRGVQQEIENARKRFNEAVEQELIEQCVFELNALQARYTYFLRLLREYDERPAAKL